MRCLALVTNGGFAYIENHVDFSIESNYDGHCRKAISIVLEKLHIHKIVNESNGHMKKPLNFF